MKSAHQLRAIPLVVVFVAVVLIAAACGQPEEAVGLAGESQVRTVQVDGRTGDFRGSYRAFFPNEIRVGPGDTVVFRSEGVSEGHTVTLGSLATEAVTAHDTAVEQGDPPPQPDLPRVDLIDLTQTGDVEPAVVERCVVEEDDPMPEEGRRCPGPVDGEEIEFDGTQPYISSGLIDPREEFALRISPDTEPGTYPFFCGIHGPGMSGTLVVEEAGASIPTQAEVDEDAQAQFSALREEAREEVEAAFDRYDGARAGDFPFPALAGMVLLDGRVEVHEFVPFTIRATAGEEVTWRVSGVHSISFEAPGGTEAPLLRKEGELRIVRISRDNLINVLSDDPPEEPPSEPVILEGAERERGSDLRHSSGLLLSPEGEITYRMRFAEPATFRYQCLVHPGMNGIVMVSGGVG